MTDAEIFALAKCIPDSINLLDDTEATEFLTRKLCPDNGISLVSIAPHIDEIKSVALAVRLGAFA